MNLILLLAATLTFENTSPTARWFSILQLFPDGRNPVAYVRTHPNPGTIGPVTVDLPGNLGECYWVTAIAPLPPHPEHTDRGPSRFSAEACLKQPGSEPNAPSGTGVK